jgi:hypothetical protein
MRRRADQNPGQGARGYTGEDTCATNPLPLPPKTVPHLFSTVGRASSPSRHGQDARATARSLGAQASSLCNTGKMPVLPGKVGEEGNCRGTACRAQGQGTAVPWPSPPELLSQISLKPGRAALLWGGPCRSLAAAAAAWGVARGARVLVVDAANAFDPYRLVREARSRGLSRGAALLRVRVARAFTSHQLVRLLKEELAGELEPLSLVLVLGPVSLFYDEQIPLAERRRLFTNMVDILAACKAKAPLLLLQPPRPRGAANRRFGEMLAPLLDYLVRVNNEDDREKSHRGGRPASLPLPGA